jgi:phosphoglycolate phosphatase-like HAD superfamily hydrolase
MIEIIRPHPATLPRLAVFDFDGTLSLVRSGWQQVMSELMVEALLQAPRHEVLPKLQRAADDYIARSTGQPTIEQMTWLATAVERRGGAADTPVEYKHRFEAQLRERIDQRLADLSGGLRAPETLLVPGTRALLDALHDQKLPLALISGTDHDAVVQEAGALQIAGYFADRIYAPNSHDPEFSKLAMITRLLAEYNLPGQTLVSFGDGPAETAATHAVGGLAIGIALDEAHGSKLDRQKRAILIASGADIVIPHFGEHARLVELLFDAEKGD